MAKYEYARFKIRIAPDSGKRQGLHAGDVVRRQYADGTRTFYSLMVVLATGEDSLQLPDGKEASSPYFIGALIEGDEPRDGELLDFVRLTSLTDERRSGALYLTASDEEAPYLDVIDGMGTERSLCRPASLAAFGCSDNESWSYRYTPSDGPVNRIIRITRSAGSTSAAGGLQIPFAPSVSHPQRLVISFRIRASKALSAVPLRFGYADGTEADGQDTVAVTTGWQYRLSLITVDFPAEYARVLAFDLAGHLAASDWCEIADLNVCLLEHLSAFADASKIRIGKITGIADPLFGLLQGYGAYFQRLYATRDVNVAGTLTAGDERGFGSTFYAGRIHKNCILNSLNCNFTTTVVRLSNNPPAGIGKNALIAVFGGTLLCQTEAWCQKHAGERYCLSFWCYCTYKQGLSLTILRGEKELAVFDAPRTWQRVHLSFDIEHIPGEDLRIDFRNGSRTPWFFSAPQLEKGDVPTLYQPTDDTLNETDEYGAWFCRGGVGGTIQHPLLRLEADGSIRAGNNSFVINPDGSGYFSGGAIRWDDSAVTFSENVKLQWDNLDEEARHNLSGEDGYSVYSDTPSRLFPADSEGRITADHRFDIRFHAFKGRQAQTAVVGELPQISGMEFSFNANKTGIAVTVRSDTSTLAESGSVYFPITVDGVSFSVPFAWSIVRAGAAGKNDVELDWIQDWNNNRTQIGSTTLITPKLFAGVKNADGTVTGTAIGRFALSTKTASGGIVTETVDGICGFRDGYKTFLLDNGGNIQLGYGDQFVRYDAAMGKISFGAGVSLNWTSAIDAAKTETLNAAAATAQSKADAALGTAKSYADTKKSEAIDSAAATAQSKADTALGAAKNYADTKKAEAITQAGKDADGKISTLTATLNASIADAKKAGTDARAVADAITSKAATEGWSNKLTYIDGNGIFTGQLSADTVSAIHINASQITAGTIDTARLNAAEIRSDIINAAYINGLTCAFVRGTIGGWNIGATTLSNSHILLDSGNKRVVVYGANSGAVSGKRVQLYYSSDTDFGFYATDAAGNCLARFGSGNQIAGWSIDTSRIYKNNVALGADGSIANAAKWKLNNDGSGSLASGNISWDAAGNVAFGASVSLNWTNAANSALASAKAYADTKKAEAVNTAAADATTKSDAAKELARAMAFGKMLNRDPTFRNGTNGITAYNNAGNGTVTVSRITASAPNDSGYVLEVKTTGSATPGFGGFTFSTMTGYKKIFIVRLIARIPVGRQIAWASNSIGTGGTSKWLTSTAGTGNWCEYIYKVECGTASFATTNYFYLSGGAAATTDAPVVWQLAYATVFDITSSERYTTTIDANGIYTGTLTAAQVNAVSIDAGSIRTGTLSADRLAAGSISASKLDAASLKANIINTDYINGLTCTFVRGKIGGFTIGSDNMTVGSIGAVGATPIQIRSASSGSGYWYTGGYKPLGITMTWCQNSNAGHIVFGQVAASGSTVKTGFLGIQMMTWDNVEYFCLSANYTKSGGKEIYNRIAGWAFDHASIWKNNVSLGADGSIVNGSRWRLNNDGSASFGSGKSIFYNDGSGQVANGKFKWDAAGNIIAQGGKFKDVTIQGTIRSAFVRNDPSIWVVVGGGTPSEVQTDPVHYDNVVCTQSGGWSENINLQWTLENSGRRICLVNYKWGSTISTGYMTISAPSGKYFFEDGISKSTLKFSREVIEMIGYGDDTTFFGWIVLNRRDLMTTGRYGKFLQVLASGIVTGTTSSASIRYNTFDGSTGVSVSRLGKGQYRVYLPSAWGLAGKYMVVATGIYSTAEDTPIYPTVKATYSYYFDIYTQDDASRNDGSFNFMVISTNNWDH